MNGDYKDVRYVKLYFVVEMTEDAVLPVQKASALRGGMGEMLLRTCCISDRNCENCGFEKECLVRRIMYSKMEIQPEFMSSGDSVGYVLECDDYRTDFYAGDRFEFRLILIGKTIVYFSQILDAFYKLGLCGIGKENAGFRIVSVFNSLKETVLDGKNVYMERVKPLRIGDYIDYRRKKLSDLHSEDHTKEIYVRFISPLSVKHNGQLMEELDLSAFYKALERRLYVLCCFEGIETEKKQMGLASESENRPEFMIIRSKLVEVPRFSFRKGQKMILKGIEGEAVIKDIPSDFINPLIAGELVHIGKNTSFGFGKYVLKI